MVALAVVITKRSAKVYQATGIIQVNIPTQPGSPDTTNANQALAQNYATLLVSRSFLDRIRPQVKGGHLSTGDIESRLSASAAPQAALVQLHAEGSSPQEAQTLATQVIHAFLSDLQTDAAQESTQQQTKIQQLIASLSAHIAALQAANPQTTVTTQEASSLTASRAALISQSASLVANSVAQGSSASLPAPPAASSSPIKPQLKLNLLAGLLLGVMLGVGIAWLREQLRPWLRSSDEAVALIDVPLLASIPLRPKLRAADPVLPEVYEVLRANLFLTMGHQDFRMITFVGPNPKVGKTSTVEGLARVAVRGGRSVLIVDGDLRAATLSSRLGHGMPSLGLGEVLLGETNLDGALVQLGSGLSLLPTRPATANPPSLLSGERMRALCAEMRERFDIVLIDSPPIVGLADGLILASLSDAAVIVVRTGLTKPVDLTMAAASVLQSQTPIAGLAVFEERTVDEYYYPSSGTKNQRRRDPAMTS